MWRGQGPVAYAALACAGEFFTDQLLHVCCAIHSHPQEDEAKAQVETDKVAEIKDDCQADLDKAMPAYNAAIKVCARVHLCVYGCTGMPGRPGQVDAPNSVAIVLHAQVCGWKAQGLAG